jgi:propionyl-CoA carboxylase beta chain
VVPQISAIMGPCAGGAVYSPAITDFIVHGRASSYMHITGPDVVKTVTHEDTTSEELGGARRAQRAKSGVAHLTAPDDASCLAQLARAARVPAAQQRSRTRPAIRVHDDPTPHGRGARLDRARRVEHQPYDMRRSSSASSTTALLRGPRRFARNMRDRLRAPRRPASSASSPTSRTSSPACLDIDASRKGARFIRFCDAFNIPLVTFEDVPGFLPGTAQEYGGIITHGAKLLYAYCEATVPKLTVITRKAYGGAYDVMNEQAHPRRPQPRLADGRDRGHGRRRARRRSSSAARSRRPRTRQAEEAAGRRLQGDRSPTPTRPRRAATSTTSSSRAARARC